MAVLATGKLQTPDPRAQHFFQTPKSGPPLLEKQKKIWAGFLQSASRTKGGSNLV